MNILISSTLMSIAIIILAHSIYELRPHTRHKKRKSVKKSQPITRANVSVIDLTMTDLRRGGGSHD